LVSTVSLLKTLVKMTRSANKRHYSPKKQTSMTAFSSGRGGGRHQPTSSAERAAARRRQTKDHHSATDQVLPEPSDFVTPSRKHVAKTSSIDKGELPKKQLNVNRYESLSEPDDDDEELGLDNDNSRATNGKEPNELTGSSPPNRLSVANSAQFKPHILPSGSTSSGKTKHNHTKSPSSTSRSAKEKDINFTPQENTPASPTLNDDQKNKDNTREVVVEDATSDSSESSPIGGQTTSAPFSSFDSSSTSDHSASTTSVRNRKINDSTNTTDNNIERVINKDPSKFDTIDVRGNPEGALAHFEEQLKTFPDPIFSPEVEAQVRADAAAGKERNRRQKEALDREMEPVNLTQSPEKDAIMVDQPNFSPLSPEHVAKAGKETNQLRQGVLPLQKNQATNLSATKISLAPHIPPSNVFTPTVHDLPSSNTHSASGKRTQFVVPDQVSGDGSKKNPPSNSFNPRLLFDKQILLKKGVQRQHIHRYELCIIIKTLKKDEDEEVWIQKTLQRFLDTMLRADPTTLIPPYLELDRLDKNVPDLGKDKPVSELEDYSDLKRYFARLSNRNTSTGKVYASVILAQSRPFREILDRTLSSLRNQEISIYTKATDHESPTDVGWFLYSSRFQDDERLTDLISKAVGEHIGIPKARSK
jgi:hypothetical protein